MEREHGFSLIVLVCLVLLLAPIFMGVSSGGGLEEVPQQAPQQPNARATVLHELWNNPEDGPPIDRNQLPLVDAQGRVDTTDSFCTVFGVLGILGLCCLLKLGVAKAEGREPY